jgi:hypothetical protein
MSFIKFLHHLFNPHCDRCRHEELENKVCESCEVLKQQLDIANSEKRALLATVKEIITPQPIVQEAEDKELKPIQTITSWKVKRAMLEKEDRMKADAERRAKEAIAESNKSTEELEKELGITSEGTNNG